jgi:hypothetical protein
MPNRHSPSNDPDSVAQVISKANDNLQNLDPTPFSENAFTVLKEKISDYIGQLVSESSKVAKRYRADTISAAHVDRASEYLVANTSRRFFRHLGTLGGLLLGASLSNLLSMTTSATYTTLGIVITTALGLIGAFMVATHISKD